jgi:hypothetical protein
VAEKRWAGMERGSEPDAAGRDDEGFGGAVGFGGSGPHSSHEAAMNGAPKMMNGPPATQNDEWATRHPK